jgi:hypothetical protein
MRLQRTHFFILILLMCSAGPLTAQRGRGPQWELLGTRAVTDRADHDTITVTAAKGTFRAVRFEVVGRAVDFQRVVIHFRNGDDQRVALRQTIPAGGTSRVVDIDGADRVIRSIDLWYDANTLGRGGKASVRAFGRN